MPILLALLLLAAPTEKAVKVPELARLLKEKKTKEALVLLKEIGAMKGNDVEAVALVKVIRNGRLKKPPEVLESSFVALKGIGSRKATRPLLAMLKVDALDKNPAVRLGLCRAFEGSADPAAIPYLEKRLHDRDDQVIAAAAAAAAVHRHAKESVRKDLFNAILKVYVPTWNLKNSVKAELKVQRRRAERRWEIVEAPMEKSLQLLSNVTQPDPPSWRHWWNKNKKKRWNAIEH